jgi:hypothetical protein
MYSYNFCWEVRRLGESDGKGRRRGADTSDGNGDG